MFVLESLQVAAEVTLREGVLAGVCAGQGAPTERRVGDDGDVEFGAGSGDVVFEDRCVPEGEFDFDCGDGVDLGFAVDTLVKDHQ